MTQIKRSALLPYSAHHMFVLVNDVAQYPTYLDGCIGAEVISRNDEVMVARLDLAKKGIKQSFTTSNRLFADERVEIQLVDGPFQQFSGEWLFTALQADACKVSLSLEFELTSMAMKIAAGKLFNKVSSNLVDALSKRARQLYG